MDWNRKKRAEKPVRVYVEFDPDYTLDTNFICKIFGWSRATLHNRMKLKGFPQPKHFDRTHVRWHPQHVNDWLAQRGGKYD